MVMQIDIVASPASGWHGPERADMERDLAAAAALRPDLQSVGGYNGVGDLVAKINAIINADPDHPCLRSLEISAHGNPVDIDDFKISDAAAWGAQLKTLNWCDEGSIYLAGCNSGLALPSGSPPRGPVAEALASAMPFDAGQFAVHISVFGSAGYLLGTRAEGNLSTIEFFTEKEGGKKTFWDKYPGARAAQGDQVWVEFRNW